METMEQLLSETEQLPAGSVLPATELAKTGSHCGNCRIRHRCLKYRNVASGWWTEKSSKGKVAPFDIWGEVREIVADGEETVEVVLQDAAGRRTRVTGIHDKRVQPGDRAWYSLQTISRLQ